MNKSIMILMSLFISGIFSAPLFAQTTTNCTGYPKDEFCCTKNRGTMVSDSGQTFCYLNLLTTKVTKADCMEAGGYTYWRNDTTMFCLPKGMMVMTGTVSSVNDSTSTMIFVSGNEAYTIHAPALSIPDPAEPIDLYYIIDPEGIMHAKHATQPLFQSAERSR